MNALKDKVVVITGASSGIGRATALEFAQQGAKVVLAARDGDALREAEQEVEAMGGQALSITCDVTKEEQVEILARRAEDAYGTIDIWINNAGVALFAKFDESPSDDYRRVIDTNFFGYVHGARSALRRFKQQGSGTLINVDSVEGVAPKPYHSAYAAAKHAVRALTSSLRMELALDGAKNIQVCTILPASVDTPLFAHAANYTGHGVSAPETSSDPAEVAVAITKLAKHPQREVILGKSAKSSVMQYLFAPSRYERKTSRLFPARHLTDDETAPGHGNLYKPTGPHSITGGWRKERIRPSLAPWMLLGGAVIGLGALATWMFWPNRKRTNQIKQLAMRASLKPKTMQKLIPAKQHM